MTEDALGSVRVVTNSFGEVKARRDFLPFGEELFAGIGNRNTNQKYSANGDDTRKKFATYQRDVETGLDYAQSRYYSPMFGRFTSPDEFKGGPDELFDFEDDASNNPTFYADLTNPQSLNKYQYTYNNPYKYTDSDGHCPKCDDAKPAIAVPLIPVVVAAIAYILSNPTPIGPRQPQSTGEIVSDVLGVLPGGRGAGGVIGGILTKVLKSGSETVVKQTVRQTTKQTAKRTTKQTTKKTGLATPKQKATAYAANKAKNGNKLKCENCKTKLVPAKKSQKGVKPPPNEAQVDHIIPRNKGGTNDPKNLQILCRGCNRKKSDTYP